MDQKKIWKEYITAQVKILEHKSKPIRIDISEPVIFNNQKLKISIDQEIFKKEFKRRVKQIFKIDDFDFDTGYIQTSIDEADKIPPKDLNSLKKLANTSYINFNENPVIQGEITSKNSVASNKLFNIIGQARNFTKFKNSGLVFLTIDDWKRCKSINNLEFEKRIGAVFPIKPTVSFLISSFYKNIDITQNGPVIEVFGSLNHKIEQLFKNKFGLTKKSNDLFFDFSRSKTLSKKIKNYKKKGLVYPEPEDNKIKFYYSCRFYKENDSSLNFEYLRLKKSFKRFLPDEEFIFYYTTKYVFDYKLVNKGLDSFQNEEELFWKKLYNKIHGNKYQISRTSQTISFDFESEDDLNEKLIQLKSVDFLDIYDRGEYQRYKFHAIFDTGLHELQNNLKKELPNLNTDLVANGAKLKFNRFYKTGNKGFVRDVLSNKLNKLLSDTKFNFNISDTFQEKYICEEKFELKVEQEEEKLAKLLRTDFCFGNSRQKFYLGKLLKVDYPDLYFVVDEERIGEVNENISKETVENIFPDLKGEKDKIKRLEDTVLKLDSEEKLLNDNAKEFLYDSSIAKSIEKPDTLFKSTSEEYQDFEKNLFSTILNPSQRKAIFKTLYSEELALIQGPPGTGKSTAIAEIIWQHIRKKQTQKILLTSETNLAVDNAIDRLKNEKNNVVKPIRFGNEAKLDSEGYFYSLTAIENWENDKEAKDNTVSHWIGNISRRVDKQENEQIESALEMWKNHLQNPSIKTKKLFSSRYLNHVNLIGATGSSIGKLNSEQKWTSFFRSYLKVFNKNAYKDKVYKVLNSTNISFDNVIMDEASKATPPELALPLVYGKKAIIVGDHRQLPPMIDGEEIKDLLISIGEKKLAETLSQKEFEISQFERLFKNIDESLKGTFDTQYRMHPAINEAIAQFYTDDGGLKCGLPPSETYHNSFEKWDSRYHGLKFKNIISPQTHTMWVNINSPEIKEGTSRINYGEIDAIDNVLTAIENCEGKLDFDEWLSHQSFEEKQIGLISFYGKQISYIDKMLNEKHSETPVRLSTVDRFQGMERNIIIVSMVRSNKIASFPGQEPDLDLYPKLGFPKQDKLGFAQSPNRLNVALSRAKRLLIVIGNSEHFCQKPIYKNVYEKMQKTIDAEELQKAVEQNG